MALDLTLFPLAVGNAVRVFWTPPAGAEYVRVLRRTADAFTGPGDAGARVVTDEDDSTNTLDRTGLVNGTAYFYRAYAWDGATWTAGPTASATPAATYQGDDIDPQTLLRERLELGLAVEVTRGVLKPRDGRIEVLMSPYAMARAVAFPVVSVILVDDSQADRVLGEELYPELVMADGDVQSTEGWLSKTTLSVIGIAQTADERAALRQAIARVMAANFPIFADAGLVTPNFSQRDEERLPEAGNAALFITAGTFDCLAPSYVTETAVPVAGVTITANLPGADAIHG